jgi:hypothetical protein
MRKLILLPVLAALFALLLGLAMKDTPITGVSEEGVSALVEGLLRRCQVIGLEDGEQPSVPPLPCLEGGIGVVVEQQGVEPVVDEMLAWYERDPMKLVHCHTMMHMLGSYLEPTVGKTYPFADRWEVCGSGLIHGAFETLAIEGMSPKEAGAVAIQACAAQQFASEDALLRDCAHSVGHSVHAVWGDRISEGETACTGAAVEGYSVASSTLLSQCMGGLYMDEAKRLLAEAGGTVPDTREDWEHRFDHCRSAADVFECVTSFSRYAASSPASATSFFQWCDDLAPADSCLHRIARDLGTKTALSGDRVFFDTCLSIATGSGTGDAPCTDGLLAASGIAGQTGDRSKICAILQERGSACR